MDIVQSSEVIAGKISAFLLDHPNASLKQRGLILFGVDTVEHAVEDTHGRCSLHFWSEFLNMRRTVTAAEESKGSLRLVISRLGTKKREVLWLLPGHAPHIVGPQEAAALRYAVCLQEFLARDLLEMDYPIEPGSRSGLMTAQRQGAYVRGLIKPGRHRWAFLGLGEHGSASSIDGLTRAGLMWLSQCRDSATVGVIAGLKLICPQGRSAPSQCRISWLSLSMNLELYELHEETGVLTRILCEREALCSAQIVSAFSEQVLLNRSIGALAELLPLLPAGAAAHLALQPLSPTTLSVRLHGFEFALVHYRVEPDSFKLRAYLYAKSGSRSALIAGPASRETFRSKMATLFEQRNIDGVRTSSYYRRSADAWLAERVRELLGYMEPAMVTHAVYRDVEVSSAGFKDSIDLLALSGDGQLSIFSIRASENTLVPMRGLDQWIRIRELNRSGALKQAGYFPGCEVSGEDPQLIFVAPALRLHKTTERMLSYVSSAVKWSFIGVNEKWRENCTVIYRKASARPPLT